MACLLVSEKIRDRDISLEGARLKWLKSGIGDVVEIVGNSVHSEEGRPAVAG